MNIAIILSGGVGTRVGTDIPKQYIKVCGKPIIWYCLQTFLNHERIDAIVIVVAEEWKPFVETFVRERNTSKPVFFSEPGETRQFSVFNALKKVEELGYNSDDIVIIHDAARPLVSSETIVDCLDGCSVADGVLPVIPVKDTMYQSADGINITSLLKRSELFAGQAPEAFNFGKYLSIHKLMSYEEILKINGSTEIAYKNGFNIKLVKGSEMNFKITTPEDLNNFENIIRDRIIL